MRGVPGVWQCRIVEITRVVTDTGFIGYTETLPHCTWARVTDEAADHARGGNAVDFLGDDSLGAGRQMAIGDVVGKALAVPVYRLRVPTVRDWCPLAWWNTKAPPGVLAEEAKDADAEGYRAHTFNVHLYECGCRGPVVDRR